MTESGFVVVHARAEFLPPRDLALRDQPETLADQAVMDEVWRDNIYRLQGGILQGGTVLDLGACFGAFTLLALATHPDERVIAVEPDPENLQVLKENLALNDWGDRADIWCAAVGEKNTNGDLEGTGPEATVIQSRHGSTSICSLATILEDVEGPIDWLKVDVEGAEYETIQGAARDGLMRRFRFVSMELHPTDLVTFGALLATVALTHSFEVIGSSDGGGMLWGHLS